MSDACGMSHLEAASEVVDEADLSWAAALNNVEDDDCSCVDDDDPPTSDLSLVDSCLICNTRTHISLMVVFHESTG